MQHRKEKFLYVALSLSFILLSLLVWGFSAQHVQGSAGADLSQVPGQGTSLSKSQFDVRSAEIITFYIYLPALSGPWVPPCGGIPVLTSPQNGANVTMATTFEMDGSKAGGQWLQLDFSTSSNFTGFLKTSYLQPAGPWSKPLSEFTIFWTPTPGVYYWRTSVWCGGPGWPPPPVGYNQSPYSETRWFTLVP
jgi:hypothetical protein